MTKHTPGPWFVGPHPGNNAGTDWRMILSSHDPNYPPLYVAEAIEPDACLIAAAPDLLAALRAIVKLSDDLDPEGLFQSLEYINARAAIAKAEAI